MRFTVATVLATAASLVSAGPIYNAGTHSVTPHAQYSSSVGVLGCKINTNRVAYWPGSVDCDNICVVVSYGGRSMHLLKIDSSEGAYDISYDAWNYLYTGAFAADAPTTGGGVQMDYKFVPASECAFLMEGNKLGLTAANSMNYVASCLSQPDSWVAKNHVLYNIADPLCHNGHNEECSLDMSVSNQPSCPSGLGAPGTPQGIPLVVNIEYGTGKKVPA